MARKNPLGTIKDAALGTILQPKATAEKAVGTVVEGAKGGVGLGKAVAGQVAAKATDTVTSLLPGRKPTADRAPDLEPAEPAAASRKSQGDPMSTKAAPAPAPVTQAAKPEPVTAIDAAADATEVDVTPADIAPAVKKAPAKKTAAKKAPAKKAPAKKAAVFLAAASTPGDKLPPPTS